jgi:hypothetical protein
MIPVFRVIAIHTEEPPDGVEDGIQILLRYDFGDEDVTVFLEEGVVLRSENSHEASFPEAVYNLDSSF